MEEEWRRGVEEVRSEELGVERGLSASYSMCEQI